MDLRKKLMDMAREATGDPEIAAVGDFQPKGMTWKVGVGAAAGAVLGDAVGNFGDVGAVAGAVSGRAVASAGQLPPVIIMAASPSRLYLMTTNNAKGIILAKSLLMIDTLERDHLTVQLKQRVTTRTVVLTDESTGHEYKMEGKRIIFHHMNEVLDLLGGIDHDQPDDDQPEELVETAEHPR